MNNLISEFSVFLSVEKGLSENTISSYSSDIIKFDTFLDIDLKDVTLPVIRKYIAHLTDLGRKRTTVTRAMASIKEFYKYLESEYNIESPAATLKSYVVSESLPKYLSTTDMDRILEVARTSNVKTRLIVELLYGTGCRVSELANLQVSDIDLEEGFLNILGKGNKERWVPVPAPTLVILVGYLTKNGISKGWVFPKSTDPSQPTSRNAVANLIKDVSRRAEVNSNVSPHTMRHTYATHLLENGCDMGTLQELLGHSDIATTKIYAKVTKDAKKKALSSFHPLSQ